ncbi:hypothetical protein [Brevundimonas sp.]|uniref:hypothetical protein n=1 Tax=Brevundimonas sp. TaxID=1871086 RepID=UPI002D31800F|nr:hypothetical protein [Brevundimonas sp.]HYC69135.1 hypothetical protein [Brevundimonas sp.]
MRAGGAGARAPWHLWAAGIVAILWNAGGCLDYVMTQVQGDAWLANMEPTQTLLDWFHGLPAWYDAAWAIAVWGGLLGGVLLLARRRWATPVFVLSLLGWTATAVYALALSNGMEVMGAYWPIQIVHLVIGALFVWYAMAMSQRGVLR